MNLFDISFHAEKLQGLIWAYVLQFTLFTVLALVARGPSAVRWPTELVKSARVNWAFIVINSFLAPAAYAGVAIIQSASEALGAPGIPPSYWSGVSVWIPALLAMIAVDFLDYWSHRLRHHRLLWPMHAVHHSDTHLNYLSWYRAHILEHVFIKGGHVVLAAMLGATPGMVAGLVVFTALHQQYVHMNVDWSHGPLRSVLASPRFHRWHHADDPAAYDKNFSNLMPIWDKLFGTYYCPGPCQSPLGFPGNPGENVRALMLYPFKEWGRMAGQALLGLRRKRAEISEQA